MAAKLQCEICGGKLIGKPGGIFECENCGTEYSTEWARAKIQEITGTVKVEGTVEVTGRVQVDSSASKEALLQRGKLALEDGKWEDAKIFFNRALDLDAQCAEAYLGLAMAEETCRDREELWQKYTATDSPLRLNGNGNLNRARQFSKELDAYFLDLNEEGKRKDAGALRERERAREEKIRYLKGIREKNAVAARVIATPGGTLGLKTDGTVIGIGRNSSNELLPQCDVSDWADIVAICGNGGRSVGLRADGTVVTKTARNNDIDVSGWKNIKEVFYAYNDALLGITTDGRIVSAGFSEAIQNELNSCEDVVSIRCQYGIIFCLRTDGSIFTLYTEESTKGEQDKVQEWRDIVAIDCSRYGALKGLKTDGTVVFESVDVGWSYADRDKVRSWSDIVAIADGLNYIVGLKADGTVVAAGKNNNGQCNVTGWRNVVAISAGTSHTVGVQRDGTVVATKYVVSRPYDQYGGQCDVSGWKLFNNYESIEEERKAIREKAEAERKAAAEKAEAERKAKIEALTQEKAELQAALPNVKGLFAGSKKAKMEARLAEINAELKKLGG